VRSAGPHPSPGRHRLFLTGLAVFTGASAAAALSPGTDELITFRVVQGVGAAIMMPLTLTLLTAAVPPAAAPRSASSAPSPDWPWPADP
jgi:MFS family permease